MTPTVTDTDTTATNKLEIKRMAKRIMVGRTKLLFVIYFELPYSAVR